MIRRLAGAAAQAESAVIAGILSDSFDVPAQRWSESSVASTLAAPGTAALLAADGCALLRVAADEAELLTIAVRPRARGRGLGAALLEAVAAEAAALGAVRLHLEVGAGNAPALALYGRAGFAEAGRRPRYYAGGVDAVLMARTL